MSVGPVNGLTGWLCETCGVQSAPAAHPPARCPICEDDRQYVGWRGQRCITNDAAASGRTVRFADEDGVMTMTLDPGFAINQRAFLIPHQHGHVMWECLAIVTGEAVAKINAIGGVSAIAISHPHFYGAMADWSEALGGVPVYLHEADRGWVQHAGNHIRFWGGERCPLAQDIELVRLGGHFPGSAGLWWRIGPRPGGCLFAGDAIQVSMDRRFASFMYSYPNAIPLGPSALRGIEATVDLLEFEDLFGFSTGRQIVGKAKAALAASFDRYRAAIAA